MEVKSMLSNLYREASEMKEQVASDFASFSKAELSQQASPEKWSAMECFAHMNISNRYYLDRIKTEVGRAGSKGEIAVEKYNQGMLGKMFVNQIAPTPDDTLKKRMKTFKWLEPRNKPSAAEDSLHEFIQMQDEYIQWIEKANVLDVGKIKVRSAVGNIIRFKLGDALCVIHAHNKRHVLQARKAAGLLKRD